MLKLGKTPVGPTLYFRIEKYCLMKSIRKKLVSNKKKKYHDPTKSFNFSPLVVLNNFERVSDKVLDSLSVNKSKAISLSALSFQNMFPKININKVKVADCKRIILFNYASDKDIIEVRHYLVQLKFRNISKNLKKVLENSKDLDLSSFKNFSEVLNGENRLDYVTSDSEFESRQNIVKITRRETERENRSLEILTMDLGGVKNFSFEDDNGGSSEKRVKLTEIGPRIDLQLMKIEDNMFSGEVKYHLYEQRTQEQILELRKKTQAKKALKEKRKRVQEENVLKKKMKRTRNKSRVRFETEGKEA